MSIRPHRHYTHICANRNHRTRYSTRARTIKEDERDCSENTAQVEESNNICTETVQKSPLIIYKMSNLEYEMDLALDSGIRYILSTTDQHSAIDVTMTATEHEHQDHHMSDYPCSDSSVGYGVEAIDGNADNVISPLSGDTNRMLLRNSSFSNANSTTASADSINTASSEDHLFELGITSYYRPTSYCNINRNETLSIPTTTLGNRLSIDSNPFPSNRHYYHYGNKNKLTICDRNSVGLARGDLNSSTSRYYRQSQFSNSDSNEMNDLRINMSINETKDNNGFDWLNKLKQHRTEIAFSNDLHNKSGSLLDDFKSRNNICNEISESANPFTRSYLFSNNVNGNHNPFIESSKCSLKPSIHEELQSLESCSFNIDNSHNVSNRRFQSCKNQIFYKTTEQHPSNSPNVDQNLPMNIQEKKSGNKFSDSSFTYENPLKDDALKVNTRENNQKIKSQYSFSTEESQSDSTFNSSPTTLLSKANLSNLVSKDSVTNIEKCKKSRYIGLEATQILEDWYQENVDYPYPSKDDIEEFCTQTKLAKYRILAWMSNKRNRNQNTIPKKSKRAFHMNFRSTVDKIKSEIKRIHLNMSPQTTQQSTSIKSNKRKSNKSNETNTSESFVSSLLSDESLSNSLNRILEMIKELEKIEITYENENNAQKCTNYNNLIKKRPSRRK